MTLFPEQVSPRNARVEVGRLVPLAVLLVLYGLAISGSWHKWADIQIDFGSELYMPWQISQGKVLYRDIAHYFGPLSQYFYALLFKSFGASYSLLCWVNIMLAALFLAGLYCFFIRITNMLTAFTCGLATITLSLVSHTSFVANYNFISPYSHEAIHGVMLAAVMIVFLWKATVDMNKRYFIAAGLVFGLVFMTKSEVLVAAAMPVLFSLSLLWRPGRITSAIRDTALFFACALVPSALVLLSFSAAMPLSEATEAFIAPWRLLANARMTGNSYFRAGMGLTEWQDNLHAMAVGTVVVAAPVAFVTFLPRRLRPHARSVSCLSALAVQLFVMRYGISSIVRALPLLDLLSIGLLAVAYVKSTPANRARQVMPLLMWAIFATALLAKTVLNTRLHHYGFYLTLPSIIAMIFMLTRVLPGLVQGPPAARFERFIPLLIVMMAMPAGYLKTSYHHYTQRTYPIGLGSDRILTYAPEVDPRSAVIKEAIEWIQLNLREDETFTAIPEGVMLNYLSRRVNPGRYISFTPPELAAYGEEIIVEDLVRHPPDYVLLVHKDPAEYGVGFFGSDARNGSRIMAWVRKNYRPVTVFGATPLRGPEFGIEVLRASPADQR